MYGCPHCFKIIRTKKAFERHLEDCKKRNYSCELCDLKFNEPELLEIHKKSHEKSDQDIPKYEIIETVDDEDDDSDFDTDIAVEEPSTGSAFCEDPDTKPENEVICDDSRALAGPSDITIKMEFSAEETKLQNLPDKQIVACTSSHNSVVEQLSNHENSSLHQDAPILEASTHATSLRSKLRLAGISSNIESETDTSDETNTVKAEAADESCGSENVERSINDQDSQPSDDEHSSSNVEKTAKEDADVNDPDEPYECDLSFQKKNSRKHHKKVVHDKALYECAHCAKKFRYKCRLLPHLKTHFDTLYVPKKKDDSSTPRVASKVKDQCPYCYSTFWKGKIYNKHIYHCGPRDCDICHRKFDRYHQLTYHVKKFHREMRLRCPTCPKIYIDKRDFNLHAACCAKRKFRCDICSLKFKRKFTMECHKSLTHNRVIKPDKPFGILLEDTNINIKTELVLEGTTLQPQDVELRYPPRIMNGPRTRFPCPICKKEYATKSGMHYHKRVHYVPRFKCPECGKWFHFKSTLLKHMRVHSETSREHRKSSANKPQKCPICEVVRSGRRSLRDHIRDAHTEHRFKCTVCPKAFHRRASFLLHSRNHERLSKELAAVDTKKLKLCKVCSLPFPNIKRRQHHMITKHRDPQFKCSKCEKQFYYTTTLKRHELLHLKKEMGNLPQEKKTKRPPRDPLATKTCQECKAVFPSYRTKYHHMITEHTEPKYACKYCSKRFHFSACITRHLKIHEGPKANQKCSICSEQFDREEDKWQHMRKVHGTAQYRCNECSETFMNFPQMKRHLQNRHGKDWTNRRYTVIERRHRKSVPNARSPSANPSEPKDNGAQSSDYEMDYASSRGEDSETARATNTQGIVNTCKDCGEQFASSKESYYHTLKKHRDSLFKCSQCPSAFIALQNLARHEQEAHRIVLSKRVVEKTCSKCRLQFPNKSMKFKHMVAVHGATLFQCPQCPKVFIYKHTLIRHQETAHIQQKQNLPRLTSSTLSSGIDKPDIKTVIYEKRSVENNPSIDENTMEIRIGELEIIETVVEDTEMAGNKTDESTMGIETEDVSNTIGWSQTRMDIRNGNTCLCCELQFTTSLEAYNHMIEQHREILIMCSQCQNLFVDKESFQIHELIHHKPSKPVLERTCNICGLMFSTRSDKYYHMVSQHMESLFRCSFCPKFLVSDNQRIRHERVMHSEPHINTTNVKPSPSSFPCSYCPRVFSFYQNLWRHEKTIHSTESAPPTTARICTICVIQFKTQGEKFKHVVENHRDTMFECTTCSKLFIHKASVTRHEKTVHGYTEESRPKLTDPTMCSGDTEAVVYEIDELSAEESEVHGGETHEYATGELEPGELEPGELEPGEIARIENEEEIDDHRTNEVNENKLQERVSKENKAYGVGMKKLDIGMHIQGQIARLLLESEAAKSKTDETKTDEIEISNTNQIYEIIDDDSMEIETEEIEILDTTVSTQTQQKKPSSFQCGHCPRAFSFACNLKRHVKTIHGVPGMLQEPIVELPTPTAGEPIAINSKVYPGEDNTEVESAVNAEKQDEENQRYGNVTNELALTLTSTEGNASGIRTDENTINYIDFDENKLIQHTMEENQVDDVNSDENNLDAGIYEIEIFDVPSAENMKIESITDAAETDEHRMDYNTDHVEMLDIVKELTADETKADEYMMEYNTAEVGLSDTINEEDVTGKIAFDEMEIKTEGIEISDAIVSMTTMVIAHSDSKLVEEVIQTEANTAAGNVADEGKTDENGVDRNEADDNAFFEEIDIDYDVAEGNEITNAQATSELKREKLFKCPLCACPFVREQNLLKHKCKKVKDGTRKYECSKCPEVFNSKLKFMNHLNTHYTFTDKSPCDKCGKTFHRACQKNYHMVHVHSEPNFKCSICSKKFFYAYHMELHMTIHQPPIGTDSATENETVENEAANSIDDGSTTDEYETDESESGQENDDEGNEIIEIGDDGTDEADENENDKSESRQNENDIIEIEDDESDTDEVVAVQSKENDVIEIGSDDENESDKTKDSCKTQENDNVGSQAPYTKQIVHACSGCGLQFATSRENYYHMLENHRESLFKCSHCPSAFIRKQSLLRHEQTHKQHQPTSSSRIGTNDATTTMFKCSSCPKTFDSKEAFVDHEKSHREVGEIVSTENQLSESDDSETFPCSKCDLEFANHRRRHYHEVTAHSDPSFKCKLCSKEFHFKTCYTRHQLTHQR
ncbi:uncharacterized protein LOC109407606 isoform X4 [Aedes albopictus]|uniref:C2H2-type domain-containing protein n=1 Tax=Aedes albopictus TaxID=7160 RepID=A0ABM1ZQ78_AEDAL